MNDGSMANIPHGAIDALYPPGGLLATLRVECGDWLAYVDHAIAMQADFIQFHYLRGPVEPALAERAHRAGLRVNLFCGPGVTAAQLEASFAAGVDFVLVADLPLALRVAQQLGISPVSRGGNSGPEPREYENPARQGA